MANQCADNLAHLGAEQEEDLAITYEILAATMPFIRDDFLGIGHLQVQVSCTSGGWCP